MPNVPHRSAAQGAGEDGQTEGQPTWSQPGFLSIERAARWTDVSVRTIERWIGRGLPTYQAGPREKVLIRPVDIEAFLMRKEVPQVDIRALALEAAAKLV